MSSMMTIPIEKSVWGVALRSGDPERFLNHSCPNRLVPIVTHCKRSRLERCGNPCQLVPTGNQIRTCCSGRWSHRGHPPTSEVCTIATLVHPYSAIGACERHYNIFDTILVA